MFGKKLMGESLFDHNPIPASIKKQREQEDGGNTAGDFHALAVARWTQQDAGQVVMGRDWRIT